MDFDNLFGDIYTLPSDNLLDISSFVVTVGGAGHDGQQGQQGPSYVTDVGYNNTNNCVDSNLQTDINHQAGDEGMVRTSIMYATLQVVKKRGRPPSKPPSREVIESRRKVSICIYCFCFEHFISQAANQRERRRMDRVNEAFQR